MDESDNLNLSLAVNNVHTRERVRTYVRESLTAPIIF